MLTMQVMACMGIIIGLFLLLGINLTDFTGNIFKRLLDGPKGIRGGDFKSRRRERKSPSYEERSGRDTEYPKGYRQGKIPSRFYVRYHWFCLLLVPLGQPCLGISFWYPSQR